PARFLRPVGTVCLTGNRDCFRVCPARRGSRAGRPSPVPSRRGGAIRPEQFIPPRFTALKGCKRSPADNRKCGQTMDRKGPTHMRRSLLFAAALALTLAATAQSRADSIFWYNWSRNPVSIPTVQQNSPGQAGTGGINLLDLNSNAIQAQGETGT